MYSLHESIKKTISDYFGDSLFITDKPITKSIYTYTIAGDYISTDTVIQLIDENGDPLSVINDDSLVGKSLTLVNDRISRVIVSQLNDTVTLESGFGIDVYENDIATIETGDYILMKSIGSGESEELNSYLNLYNRYVLEVGTQNKERLDEIKTELQFLFKDSSYNFIDNNGDPTNSIFYRDDKLGFDTYVDIENNYISKGFIRFSYQLERRN